MSKIIQRIQQFAEYQYNSIREFERDAGVTQGVFSKCFNKQSEVRTDSVENFAQNFPFVSAEWLLRGEGEMLKKEAVPENEVIAQLLEKIVQLSEENGRLRNLVESKRGTASNAEDSLSASAV